MKSVVFIVALVLVAQACPSAAKFWGEGNAHLCMQRRFNICIKHFLQAATVTRAFNVLLILGRFFKFSFQGKLAARTAAVPRRWSALAESAPPVHLTSSARLVIRRIYAQSPAVTTVASAPTRLFGRTLGQRTSFCLSSFSSVQRSLLPPAQVVAALWFLF